MDVGYYHTDRWRNFARKARQHYGFRCYVCGQKAIEVHHLHYRTVDNETLEDVRLLCRTHHYKGAMGLEKLDDIKRMERWRGAIEYPFRLAQSSWQRMRQKR